MLRTASALKRIGVRRAPQNAVLDESIITHVIHIAILGFSIRGRGYFAASPTFLSFVILGSMWLHDVK